MERIKTDKTVFFCIYSILIFKMQRNFTHHDLYNVFQRDNYDFQIILVSLLYNNRVLF